MYDTFRAFMGRPGSDFEHARENHEMRQAHSTPGRSKPALCNGRKPDQAGRAARTRRRTKPTSSGCAQRRRASESAPRNGRKPARPVGRSPRGAAGEIRANGRSGRRGAGRRAKPARAKRTRAEAGSPHETAGETHAGRVREAAGKRLTYAGQTPKNALLLTT